jgi:hypothetical protein
MPPVTLGYLMVAGVLLACSGIGTELLSSPAVEPSVQPAAAE